MSVWKIAQYVVGILVPLGMFWAEERGWFRLVWMGKSTPDSARGGSLESEAKKGGVAPASLPLLKIWDITHPVGMVGNPACVPSGMRFAPLLNRFSNGSQAVRLAVRMKSKRKTGSGHLCGSPSGSQPNLY